MCYESKLDLPVWCYASVLEPAHSICWKTWMPFVLCLLLWFHERENIGYLTLSCVKRHQSYNLLDGWWRFSIDFICNVKFCSVCSSQANLLFVYLTLNTSKRNDSNAFLQNMITCSVFPSGLTPRWHHRGLSWLYWQPSVCQQHPATVLMHMRNQVSLFGLEL